MTIRLIFRNREQALSPRGDAWDRTKPLMDVADGVQGASPRLRTLRRLRPEGERSAPVPGKAP